MVREDGILHRRLSYEVVGCAQRVHAALGSGFPERVYHRAMCMELAKQRIPFAAEAAHEVVYDGGVCGCFKVDLLVDEKIVVELKALADVCDDHVSQVFSYLKATGADLGILINFGKRRLQTKRIAMSRRRRED